MTSRRCQKSSDRTQQMGRATHTLQAGSLDCLGVIKHIFSKSNYLLSKHGGEMFIVVTVKYSFWDEDLLEIMCVDNHHIFS